MISLIRGYPLIITHNGIVIHTASGLGYLVTCTQKLCARLQPSDSQEITLLIEQVIREDAHTLYGFETMEDLYWFREMVKISGLGPRTGMAILSIMSASEISLAIQTGDETMFTRADGVGARLASKIVSEMDRATLKITKDLSALRTIDKKTVRQHDAQSKDATFDIAIQAISDSAEQSQNSIILDAVSALCALGFDKQRAVKISSQILKKNHEISLENLIKDSLKIM